MFFWIIIFLVFIVIFLFCFFYQYTPYYVTTGIYEEEGKYVSFMLENNKLLYLQNATITITKNDDIKKNMERNDGMNLSKKELLEVKGGGVSLSVLAMIGAGIVFLIGVVDGYVRPLKCN